MMIGRELRSCMCVHRGLDPKKLTGTIGLTKIRVSVFMYIVSKS